VAKRSRRGRRPADRSPGERPRGAAVGERAAGSPAYYYPTVFVTGAAIMVLELLGARVLAPYYGSSLFVWSSLITVTLVALAIGYWLGGVVADSRPRAELLYAIIALAGLATAVIAPTRGPVLQATDALGLRGGSLSSAFILFTAPLLLLGMVSPFAVKLSTLSLGRLARTAGRLYSVSTAGSFVGTLAAGFLLIPTFEVRTILLGIAIALVALSLVFFALLRRGRPSTVTAVLLAAIVVLTPGSRGMRELGNTALVAKEPSFYGEIRIVDRGPLRLLLIDGGVQSGIDTRNGLCALEYPYVIETLAYRLRPEGSRALVIGLGAGIIPDAMVSWDVKSDIVEIDPKIVTAAREHFGFDPSAHAVHVGDGRRLIEQTSERYDYVILDAFAGEMVPVHLLSREAFESARAVMEPGGILVLNYVGYREGPKSRVAISIAETLRAVFDSVETFAAGAPGEYGGNVFVASDAPIDVRAATRGGSLPFPVHEAIRESATTIRQTDLRGGPAIVFTDDHNPIDLWDVTGREHWRRDTMEFFPSWVLLS
jgi:spermidine synthase